MFIRAARSAGRNAADEAHDHGKGKAVEMTMPGVRAKEKASSEKVWKLRVETVKSCMKEAKKSPISPPVSPRKSGFEEEGREDARSLEP